MAMSSIATRLLLDNHGPPAVTPAALDTDWPEGASPKFERDRTGILCSLLATRLPFHDSHRWLVGLCRSPTLTRLLYPGRPVGMVFVGLLVIC